MKIKCHHRANTSAAVSEGLPFSKENTSGVFATWGCHDTGSTLKGMPYLMDILCIKFLGLMEERLDKQRQCFRVILRD